LRRMMEDRAAKKGRAQMVQSLANHIRDLANK
jgi:hypothetical protein